MATYCVRYLNKTICVALIEAESFEQAAIRFYAEGYKGKIVSVKLYDPEWPFRVSRFSQL